MAVIKGKSPKDLRWLRWDGSLAEKGTLNATWPARTDHPPPPVPVRVTRRQVAPTGPSDTLVINTGVSARIQKLAADLPLADKELRIPVQLKNPARIKQLMLRITDCTGALAYQEILDATRIPSLPSLTKEEVAQVSLKEPQQGQGPQDAPGPTLAARSAPPSSDGEWAAAGAAPYTVEVWVSALDGAFTNVTAKTDAEGLKRAQTYQVTVSSAFKPDSNLVTEVYRRLAGEDFRKKFWMDLLIRRTKELDSPEAKQNPKYLPRRVAIAGGLPKLRVVMSTKQTGSETGKCVDDIAARVASLQALLEDAEAKLAAEAEKRGALPADRELRMLLAPEWYFRKGKTQPPYTPAELRTIVDEVCKLSKAHPEWLIIPGTVYFGVGHAKPFWKLTAEELKAAGADILAAMKLETGKETQAAPTRAEPSPAKTWFVGNLCPVIAGGKLLHYSIKRDAGEAPREGEEFFAPYWVDPRKVDELCRGSFFAFKGLELCLEICRDHNALRAAIENAGLSATRAENVIRARAAASAALKAKLAELEGGIDVWKRAMERRWGLVQPIIDGRKQMHAKKLDLAAAYKTVSDEFTIANPVNGNMLHKAHKEVVDRLAFEKLCFDDWKVESDLAGLRAGLDAETKKRVKAATEASTLSSRYTGLLAFFDAPADVEAAVTEAKAAAEAMKKARDDLRTALGRKAPHAGVDVHVVVSNEVPLKGPCTPVRSGGAIVHCDGNSSSSCAVRAVTRSGADLVPAKADDAKLLRAVTEVQDDLVTKMASAVEECVKSQMAEETLGANRPAELQKLQGDSQKAANLFRTMSMAAKGTVGEFRDRVAALELEETPYDACDGGGIAGRLFRAGLDLGPKVR